MSVNLCELLEDAQFKVEQSAERCVSTLLDLIQTRDFDKSEELKIARFAHNLKW